MHRRSLSLKPTQNKKAEDEMDWELDLNKPVSDKAEHTENSEKELIKCNESVDKTPANEDIDCSQRDFNNISLSLNNLRKDYKIPKISGENTYEKQVSEIDNLLKNRHHVATLGYTLEENLRDNLIPKFLNVFIEFNPYFGSQEAMDFFKQELKSIKVKASHFATKKLITTCDKLNEKITKDAETVMKKNRTRNRFNN